MESPQELHLRYVSGIGMPGYEDVTTYLATHRLEEVLSDAVAVCVEHETPQPLARIAVEISSKAAARAIEFDYSTLVAEISALVQEQQCGPLLLRLAWHDAGTYSEAMGDGGANAVIRFTTSGEGKFDENRGLMDAVKLLTPLQAKHPNISHADLWALAANVAIEVMGGPRICTRFGRLDAASSTESVESYVDRLPDGEKGADHLRTVFGRKGFSEKDIVRSSKHQNHPLLCDFCFHLLLHNL